MTSLLLPIGRYKLTLQILALVSAFIRITFTIHRARSISVWFKSEDWEDIGKDGFRLTIPYSKHKKGLAPNITPLVLCEDGNLEKFYGSIKYSKSGDIIISVNTMLNGVIYI